MHEPSRQFQLPCGPAELHCQSLVTILSVDVWVKTPSRGPQVSIVDQNRALVHACVLRQPHAHPHSDSVHRRTHTANGPRHAMLGHLRGDAADDAEVLPGPAGRDGLVAILRDEPWQRMGSTVNVCPLISSLARSFE